MIINIDNIKKKFIFANFIWGKNFLRCIWWIYLTWKYLIYYIGLCLCVFMCKRRYYLLLNWRSIRATRPLLTVASYFFFFLSFFFSLNESSYSWIIMYTYLSLSLCGCRRNHQSDRLKVFFDINNQLFR